MLHMLITLLLLLILLGLGLNIMKRPPQTSGECLQPLSIILHCDTPFFPFMNTLYLHVYLLVYCVFPTSSSRGCLQYYVYS